MSENVIFCFSGTGNCLDIAKNIAKRMGDTDIIMMRKAPAVTDVSAAKRVGFVFPCYAGGLLIKSITAMDNPLVQILVLLYGALSVLGVFLGDIVVSFVDPRIKLVGGNDD